MSNIAELEAAIALAETHFAEVHQTYETTRRDAFDAHNAFILELDSQFQTDSRAAAQAVTAAQAELETALNPTTPEPEEDETPEDLPNG